MPFRESAIEDNVNGVLFARGGGSSGSCGCVCEWTVDSAGLMCHAAFFFFFDTAVVGCQSGSGSGMCGNEEGLIVIVSLFIRG